MKKLISLLLIAVLGLSMVACDTPEAAKQRFVGTWTGEAELSSKNVDVNETEIDSYKEAEIERIQRTIAASTATEPADTEATEPVATEPVATEPVATEPTGTEATEPAGTEATEPVATEPVATEPVATEPVATEPVATEPAAVDPNASTVKVTTTNRANYTVVLKDDMTGSIKMVSEYVIIVADGEEEKVAETTSHYSFKWYVPENNVESIAFSQIIDEATGKVIAQTGVDKKGKENEPVVAYLGLQAKEGDDSFFNTEAVLNLRFVDNNAEDSFKVGFVVVKISR